MSVYVDMDPKLCVFCGLCQIFCPFDAIKVYLDDKPLASTLKSGALPEILRKVEIDEETCLRVNALCERLCVDACPTGIIRFNGSCIQVNDVAECPLCGWCQAVCHSVIKVEKIFHGSIKINNEKCPDGCRNCFYVCPVNAICLGEDEKVNVIEEFCIFCGACKNHCPENNAITINITRINLKESNLWKTIAERLSLYIPARSKTPPKSLMTQWPKTFINNNQEKLRIERKTYLRRHILELDNSKCKKCQICYIICPKAAINVTRVRL